MPRGRNVDGKRELGAGKTSYTTSIDRHWYYCRLRLIGKNFCIKGEIMEKIPEECPVRDILAQIKMVLTLLDKVLDHCDKCLQERKEDK